MSGYSVEKLMENFQFIGASPNDATLAKCLELCITYKISEETFVDDWAAFSISCLKNAPPTIGGLELLERKEYLKNKNKVTAVAVQTPERKKIQKTYSSPAPPKTPTSNKTQSQLNESISQELSTILDDSASQVGNYADRLHPGKVVLTHGDKVQFTGCMSPVHVKLFGDVTNILSSNVQQMYCYAQKQRECQGGIIQNIARLIAQKHGIVLDAFLDRNSTEGTYYGTIICDGIGKLNKTSALLELPAGDYSNGDKIPLNLSQLPSYSLFPGQIAIAQGKFIKGTLQVNTLYNDAFVIPVQKFESGSVQIMAASGPFTLKSNLLYEPLQDLLKTVLEVRPHVLLLTGPFIDEEHSSINTMTESFDTFFNTLIESIMTPLDGSNIQVVIVSSLRDVHHFPIYPTPPYDLPAKYPNLLCAPDPCMLDIDGVHIGITTADVLFNIGKEELSWPSGGVDRMSRLSQYLLNQLSFYPLQSSESKMPIDVSLLERYGLMETPPHVLLVPSNFRHFVKTISGCTVINPERLVKGYSGGTYARIQISTQKELQVACNIINI